MRHLIVITQLTLNDPANATLNRLAHKHTVANIAHGKERVHTGANGCKRMQAGANGCQAGENGCKQMQTYANGCKLV